MDALSEGKVKIDDLKADELPDALRTLAPAERKAHVEKLAAERKQIQDQITKLNVARKVYLAEQEKKLQAQMNAVAGAAPVPPPAPPPPPRFRTSGHRCGPSGSGEEVASGGMRIPSAIAPMRPIRPIGLPSARHQCHVPITATKLSALLAATLFVSLAYGQGLLIVTNTTDRVPLPRPVIRPEPTPPMSYKIKELSVQARLVDQVARVQVTQSFVNTGSRPMEVSFIFPLPYDGAIDQMTFMIDGREYPAKLLPASEARRIYEGYVRRNRDPALFEWIGTGMFQTSVFPVPPGAVRQVSLRYSQLLRKAGSLTDFLFPLSTAKYTSEPVEKIELQASIESSIEIKNVYSPTHPIDIKRPDAGRAIVSYTGQNQVPLTDFRLFFDVAKGQLEPA